jgi:hypothetical protein
MEELLDPDGVWTEDLIALMLPVAIEAEADQAEAMFGAVGAAVAGLFGKEGPQAFTKGLERVRKQVREAQRQARGIGHEETAAAAGGAAAAKAGPDVADEMLSFFGQMGMKVPRKGRPPGPPKKGPGPGKKR